MILLAEKLRSTCAVLAAGALLASALAAPAAAVTDRADHAARLSACVGDAVVDQLFTDVSSGHVFGDAINCIAYYGITQGTGDGSAYSPEQDVTRAEMAVFIARAARVAGVDVDETRDAGFVDLDGTWPEARDAINGLASSGIITFGGAFRPNDVITRAEMATFLFGLLSKVAPNVTVDSEGTVWLGAAGSRTQADDHFADADNAETSALYELGVTTGASPAAVQDDTRPPLDYNYEPASTVDRGQMAAFITRALDHTSARPAGVTVQYDDAGVVVSVRDDRFQPVPGAAVDVFWATADRAGRAVTNDGGCRFGEVTQGDQSSLLCEIDGTDPVTGSDGDSRVEVTGLRRVPAGGAAVWAWTGQNGDTLEVGAEAYRLDLAGDQARSATRALVTTSFDARKVRFGDSVVFSIQLRDPVGNVRRGVDGIDPAHWRLTVQALAPDREPDVQALVSDLNGKVDFHVRLFDPEPGRPSELTAMYTLTPTGNAPPTHATVDAGGRPAATGTLIFSDAPSSIGPRDATVTIDTRRYVRVFDGEASNSVTVTVLDQYGVPFFPAARVRLDSSLSGVTLDSSAEFPVDGLGSHRFSYRYSGGGGEETLTAHYGATSAFGGTKTAVVYWTTDAGPSGSDTTVQTGDVERNYIVVDDGTPVLLVYDGNDRFNLDGRPATLAAFEAELAEAIERGDSSRFLTWSNYLPDRDEPVTEYKLS